MLHDNARPRTAVNTVDQKLVSMWWDSPRKAQISFLVIIPYLGHLKMIFNAIDLQLIKKCRSDARMAAQQQKKKKRINK